MNHSVVTPWTTVGNLLAKLEIGDLIEIKKCVTIGIPISNHWGVYMGYRNGIHKVGHFSSRKNVNRAIISLGNLLSGSRCDEKGASIQISNLFDVCTNYQCRINNSMDKDCKPLPAGVIYYRVLNRVGECGYGDRINNCEQFAKWARYDLSISEQENVGKVVMIGGDISLFKNRLLITLATTILGYFGIRKIGFINKTFVRGFKLYESFYK
uniref:LRAT domain-containing protein n=1 Tax=Strongyloides papillosus TaxID=174720 RepID=A0A0N5BI14_STREA